MSLNSKTNESRVTQSREAHQAQGIVSATSHRWTHIADIIHVARGATQAVWLQMGGSLILLPCAIALWGTSLSHIDPRNITNLGLVSALPPSFFIALGFLTISFGVTIRQQRAPTLILLAHVVTLIVIIHGTLPLVYEEPRYSWTYKHIGVAAYIQHKGSVNPSIDAYHNFPAFFAVSALFTEMAGFDSALNFAIWAQVFFNLLCLGALLLVLKSRTHNQRLIWLAVWLFYLTNWVGQDYFAPQALAFFFYIVILGICLTWFDLKEPPFESAIWRWPVLAALARLFRKLLSHVWQDDSADNTSWPLQRVGAMAILILGFSVIVSGHQLTPPMTIASVVALVVFRRCRARSLPILMIVATLAWTVFVAITFLYDSESWRSSFGLLSSNLGQNVRDLSQSNPEHAFVALVARGLSAGLWGLALMGGARRLRNGYWDASIVLISLSPIPMIATQSYGGEMLYRIFLFSLPGATFFAAALFQPNPTDDTSWRTTLMIILVSGMLLAGFVFAYYGMERMNYMSRDEVEAVQYVYRTAPPGSLVLSVTWNLPIKLEADYDQYVHISLFKQYQSGHFGIQEALYEMTHRRYPAAYLIISRGQKDHDQVLNVLPAGTYDRLAQAVAQSERFKLVFENTDVKIYTLTDAAIGGTQ